jgi:hypothetical protein
VGSNRNGSRTGEVSVKVISIDCKLVIREVSNFIDSEVTPDLRSQMEAHFAECAHCLAILDGTRNVIRLVGDSLSFELPVGFGDRLQQRLAELQHDTHGSSNL